jgi:hypothetical protein
MKTSNYPSIRFIAYAIPTMEANSTANDGYGTYLGNPDCNQPAGP